MIKQCWTGLIAEGFYSKVWAQERRPRAPDRNIRTEADLRVAAIGVKDQDPHVGLARQAKHPYGFWHEAFFVLLGL